MSLIELEELEEVCINFIIKKATQLEEIIKVEKSNEKK